MKVRTLLLSLLALVLIACSSVTFATQVMNRSITNQDANIPVTGANEFTGCAGPVIASINPDYEQAIVEQTNAIRMQYGKPPLKRVTALDESARYHAADMSVTNYFNHDTYNRVDGQLTQACDTWNRIEKYYTNWQALGENIAAGQRTPEMAMNGWMNSPEHKDNILSNNYTEIGVGFYEGKGEYRYYWDQNFGNRDDVFPLVVDGEKATTSSTSVPVYLYGSFTRMRVKNDNGRWSAWMPFKNSFNWNLPNTPGLHTVTAQMEGSDASIKTSSDTITLAP